MREPGTIRPEAGVDPPIAPLPTPMAFVAPLVTSTGPIDGAYLVAVTGWLKDDDALLEEVAVAAAGFIGQDAPASTNLVLRSRLGMSPSELPAPVFAADVIDAFAWTAHPPADFLSAFDRAHETDGDCFVFSAHCLILRSGKTPRTGGDWLPNGATYWRERPATILIDLDGLYRSRAISGLRLVLGDLIPASANLPHETAILDERAFKWTPGGFLSTVATRDAFQRERLQALDRLGESQFARPVHYTRWPFVKRALTERAISAEHSLSEELAEARRRNLALILPAIVSREVTAYESVLSTAPPRPLRAHEPDFRQFRSGLVRKLRAALNAALTEDSVGDPKWRRTGSEVPLDDESVEGEFLAGADQPESDLGSMDDILNSAFGAALVARARLTPGEKRVLTAIAMMEDGDTLTDWADRNGLSPKTASVHKSNAKRKLEQAMNLP